MEKQKCLTETGPKAHRISNINLNNTISCKGWALNDTLQLEFILNNTKEIAECSDEMNNKHKYSLKKCETFITDSFVRFMHLSFVECIFSFNLSAFFPYKKWKTCFYFGKRIKKKELNFCQWFAAMYQNDSSDKTAANCCSFMFRFNFNKHKTK